MSCEQRPDYSELSSLPLISSLLSLISPVSPQRLPSEIPDSEDQSISQDTTAEFPSLSIQTSKECSPETTRDDRIRIQTALLFNIPWEQICKVLKVTP